MFFVVTGFPFFSGLHLVDRAASQAGASTPTTYNVLRTARPPETLPGGRSDQTLRLLIRRGFTSAACPYHLNGHASQPQVLVFSRPFLRLLFLSTDMPPTGLTFNVRRGD